MELVPMKRHPSMSPIRCVAVLLSLAGARSSEAQGTISPDQIGRWLAAADLVAECPYSGEYRAAAGRLRDNLLVLAGEEGWTLEASLARDGESRVYGLVDRNRACITAANVTLAARVALAGRGRPSF